MNSDRRRRYRNKKVDDPRKGTTSSSSAAAAAGGGGGAAASTSSSPSIPLTIAKREDSRPKPTIQPKILLKKDNENFTNFNKYNSNTGISYDGIKSTIINRIEPTTAATTTTGTASSSSTSHSVSASASSLQANNTIIANLSALQLNGITATSTTTATTPITAAATTTTTTIRDKTDGQGQGGGSSSSSTTTNMEIVPPMMRPCALTYNTALNTNAYKYFYKNNTDFTVIGVLGGQNVGKSTILNLLAKNHRSSSSSSYNYYDHLFGPNADDFVFSTRLKSQRNVLRPHTDPSQLFVTKDRFILLDTPPLLNITHISKDPPHSLITHSVNATMQLLNICHIILIITNGHSLEHLRILNTALRLRPRKLNKNHTANYLPHVMFIKTYAQRIDYDVKEKKRMDDYLKQLYRNTGLGIYKKTSRDNSTAIATDDTDVNSFLIPEFHSNAATTFHDSIHQIARALRDQILATPRINMSPSGDFSETQWLDLLADSMRRDMKQYDSFYMDIKKRHLGVLHGVHGGHGGHAGGGSGGGGGGDGNFRKRHNNYNWSNLNN